jgi:hypothetical protein
MGMQTRNLNTATIKERLRSCHYTILDNTIGDLKTDKGTYAWFRMTDRPNRPSDCLGPYKQIPKDAGIFEISVDDQARLCTYLGIDSKSWDWVGSVIVDCFDWWKVLCHPLCAQAGSEYQLRVVSLLRQIRARG